MGSLLGSQAKSYDQDRIFTAFQDEEALKHKHQHLNESNSKKFPSNFIKTSRYTAVSFLPMSLLLQFQRYANIYFLVTAILQCIPQISPLSPFVAVAPLIFVLAVSMAREGYEDYQRHKSDNEQNFSAKTKRVLQDRGEEDVAWANVHVGDILHIYQDECFPTDLLVLGSNLGGVCYIETGALDGEKNLKPKSAINETSSYFSTKEDNVATLSTGNLFTNKQTNFNLTIKANKPDQDPNHFIGSIGFQLQNDNNPQSAKQIPADSTQFVPRGAFLRNTESIYAVVVYTGMDTKIMKNAEEGKAKSSDMEAKMNKFILGILIFQFLCCFVMSSCSYYWLDKNHIYYPYLDLDKDGLSYISQSVLVYFSYFILFNTMIPISLVVSLEMVKVLQSYFITNDYEMYSHHNQRWPRVLTSTINEELGQVEYVFSDKTGTLTQNQMQFKMAVIGNTLYGEKAAQKKKAAVQPSKQQKSNTKQHQHTEFVFEDDNLTNLLSRKAEKSQNPPVNITLKSKDGKATYTIPSQYELSREYFKNLGLAHECIVEKNKDPNDTNYYYQGPSPDEITLVDAAYHMGFTFVGKTSNKLMMNLTDTAGKEGQQEFTKINVFEFSSARKRMTLLLEDNGVYKMYVKGADNVIKERLDKGIHQPYLDFADKKLTEFSLVGLRTLLIGFKILSKDEVDAFVNKYNNLANSANRKEDLEKLADEVEQGFFLLGATAVEDKLQDDVPETIHDLLRANIKVWMLTGDKLETAENIAKSCKLILEDFELLVMSDKNPKVIRKEMTEILWKRFKKLKEDKVRKCFLVEGDCLKVIFEKGNEDIKKKFVQITKDCESVVCCRVSPVQKAQVVRSIREGLNKITLAIGDGANDVNMIQAAHIGCGIYGNEGMRAVQSSDFAFGQFKCLWRLLFVHGRWSYIRISEMIVYFFYKNMIFTIPQLYFAFFSGFSAQSIFDDYYISMYNLIFTALPLIIRAIFDQDVNYMYIQYDRKLVQTGDENEKRRLQKLINKRKDYIRDRLPNLYYLGQKQQLFSTRIFLEWLIQGIVHGIFIFFGSYFTVGNITLASDGYTSDMWSFSLIIFTSVVFIADLKLAIYTRYWTLINYLAFYITSIGLYIAAFFITGVLYNSYVYETPNYLVQTPHFYLVIFFIVAGIFAFDMFVYASKELFHNKTKEKALRRLMKEQPKKSNENKWIFQGSAIELESNLNSFKDKFDEESQIMLSAINLNKKDEKQYIEPQTIFMNGQGNKGTEVQFLSSSNQDCKKNNNTLPKSTIKENVSGHHLQVQTSPTPLYNNIQNTPNSNRNGDELIQFTFTDSNDDDYDIYYKQQFNFNTDLQPQTIQKVDERKDNNIGLPPSKQFHSKQEIELDD
ncbi:phospholipid-translocating P-type ATPase, flippase family protein (macronuclear) [Tetrahymena thermophila SB210]|uniref:Phospholipid-transporting ATPase n=1 Tax=Tetrahymena thermophila (strain SB210) TaxID=312017 RepID=I7LW77_TETTS|nr:phospholipid-translocating P-type ATPase, flippase family protein [Tetrahymena thermophila SB210]EAS01110.3 phospholipid-translocating P-type ATPase, flippase family protein [Tetrahymena thermophila SB210]|eukprot:XP_001021355.3 phospholipid-translocating P-type ATPase, flippase family protein [Tetrahymena thermophila SB210]